MKKLLSSILALILCFSLLSTFSLAATVDEDSTHIQELEYDRVVDLPDGGKDYVYIIEGIENHYLVPPEDFNPLTATDAQLERYCFPARPEIVNGISDQNEDQSTEYSEWVKLMENYSGTPDPDLSIRITPITDENNEATTRATSSRTSKIWSGYESNLGANSSAFYTQVQVDFKQPTISATSGSCLNSYWVGLGGRNTPKLVQAGTATEGKSNHYAWYEYLSDSTGQTVAMQVIPNLSISAGDNIHVYISFQKANGKFGYYVANNTTGKSASGYVDNLPSSTQFDGTTAEWIVERCSMVSGSTSIPYNLGKYGTVTMSNCKATLNSSNTWLGASDLSGLYKVTMTSNGQSSGTVLSLPGSLSSNNSFTCTWKAYK